MPLEFRAARSEDAPACLEMRGNTRQNPFSEEQLRSIGVTRESWAEGIRSGELPGFVCISDGQLVAYCFGVRESGEIQVLAILPDFEKQGIGRELLQRTTLKLAALGHSRLFLGCSPDPNSRSHGFYRHLGWQSTGTFDQHGDEILELYVS